MSEIVQEGIGKYKQVRSAVGRLIEEEYGLFNISFGDMSDELLDGLMLGDAKYGRDFVGSDIFVLHGDDLREERFCVSHTSFGSDGDHFQCLRFDSDFFRCCYI